VDLEKSAVLSSPLALRAWALSRSIQLERIQWDQISPNRLAGQLQSIFDYSILA
jgi:hypothetical protein